MEDLRWKKFPVLNDGFICLVDYMGDDSSVCQAARVCYGDGTRKTSDDRHLIRYLIRHQHMSPFEMCELKFMWRVPMDVWRQVVRHRTASINEYSTRYSIAIDSANTTESNEWRLQNQNNKQGSGGYLDETLGKEFSCREKLIQTDIHDLYEDMLSHGVAREQARKNLPLATYTEAYWKIDLRNLLHFLSLRMEEHAQWEIRQYANIIGKEIVAKLYPLVWEAFCDYRFNSESFTKYELNILCYLFSVYHSLMPFTENGLREILLAETIPLIPAEWFQNKCREREEFILKVCKISEVCDAFGSAR